MENNNEISFLDLTKKNKKKKKKNIISYCPNCGHGIGKISICYFCDAEGYYKEYYKQNKQITIDASKKRYNKNKVECLKGMKEYAIKNKDKLKKYQHDYYLKNIDKLRKEQTKYYNEIRKLNSKEEYQKHKLKTHEDKLFRLKEGLRTRAGMAIKNHKGTKHTSSLKLLGGDIDTVRQHLESRFKEGMSWNNHGTYGWHIDHIIPCCHFDLTDIKEQKKCFHYSNLQPLWAKENIVKGGKVDGK